MLRAPAAGQWYAGLHDAIAGDDTAPQSDVSGSSEYRTHLAQVLVRRALEQL